MISASIVLAQLSFFIDFIPYSSKNQATITLWSQAAISQKLQYFKIIERVIISFSVDAKIERFLVMMIEDYYMPQNARTVFSYCFECEDYESTRLV